MDIKTSKRTYLNVNKWKLIEKNVNIITIALCVGVYANGIPGDYVHDDISVILDNPDTQRTSPIWDVFLNDYWGKRIWDITSHKSYRPITILTFRCTSALYTKRQRYEVFIVIGAIKLTIKFENWLLGYSSSHLSHVINICLHTIVSALYGRILRENIKMSFKESFISTVMFAVHPIHTEAVTGVVGRADLLAALFFQIAFYTYNRIRQNSTWSLWVFFTFVVVLGVLSKETTVSVIGICILWDISLSGQSRTKCRNLLMRILGCVLLGIVILHFRVSVMGSPACFSKQDNPTSFNPSLLTRFLTFLYLPTMNTWLLLNPLNLSHDWQLNSIKQVESLADWRNSYTVAFYMMLLVVIATSILRTKKCNLAVVWSVGVMIIGFLPASNLFFYVGFVVAERILYIPSFGWCYLFAIGFSRVSNYTSKRHKKLLLNGACILLFVLYSSRCARRNIDWTSRGNLLISGLKVLPQNAKMHYNYGNYARENYLFKKAIYHYRIAIRLWPEYPSAHNNLGVVLLGEGDHQAAAHHFQQALLYQPHHIRASTNYAVILRCWNRTSEAILLLKDSFWNRESFHSLPYQNNSEEIIKIGLLLSSLYTNRSVALEEEVYLKLITEYPLSAQVHFKYADFLMRQGKLEVATKYWDAGLSLNPAKNSPLETSQSPDFELPEERSLLPKADQSKFPKLFKAQNNLTENTTNQRIENSHTTVSDVTSEDSQWTPAVSQDSKVISTALRRTKKQDCVKMDHSSISPHKSGHIYVRKDATTLPRDVPLL